MLEFIIIAFVVFMVAAFLWKHIGVIIVLAIIGAIVYFAPLPWYETVGCILFIIITAGYFIDASEKKKKIAEEALFKSQLDLACKYVENIKSQPIFLFEKKDIKEALPATVSSEKIDRIIKKLLLDNLIEEVILDDNIIYKPKGQENNCSIEIETGGSMEIRMD